MKLIVLLLLIPAISFADTVTTNMNATAQVASSCTISANNVAFGEVNTVVTAYASNAISVLCNKGTSYTIVGKSFLADGSHHLVGTAGNSDIINYTVNLRPNFDDAFYFGAPYNNIVASGTGTTQTHNLYYRARSGINKSVRPDNYSDSYTLTLTY